MHFKLQFSEAAKQKIIELERDKSKKGLLKQLRKVLGFMETNLKYPSWNGVMEWGQAWHLGI